MGLHRMAAEDNTKERMIEQKQQREWNCSANVKKTSISQSREQRCELGVFRRAHCSPTNYGEPKATLFSLYCFSKKKCNCSDAHYHRHSDVVPNTGNSPPSWPLFPFPSVIHPSCKCTGRELPKIMELMQLF